MDWRTIQYQSIGEQYNSNGLEDNTIPIVWRTIQYQWKWRTIQYQSIGEKYNTNGNGGQYNTNRLENNTIPMEMEDNTIPINWGITQYQLVQGHYNTNGFEEIHPKYNTIWIGGYSTGVYQKTFPIVQYQQTRQHSSKILFQSIVEHNTNGLDDNTIPVVCWTIQYQWICLRFDLLQVYLCS